MRIHDVAQRTDAWRELRAGKLTGSHAKDMLAKIKSGEAASRRNLKYRLIAERLTGCPQESGYVNAAMQWGIDHEAEAIAAYEALTGELVAAIGFCEHETLAAGCSPDGFVGEDGILSVKCPETATQIRYWREGSEPDEHAAQNTHELWITGRQWIDFVSFDPRLPDGLRLFVTRVTRSTKELALHADEVARFLAEVGTELDAIRTMAHLANTLELAAEGAA